MVTGVFDGLKNHVSTAECHSTSANPAFSRAAQQSATVNRALCKVEVFRGPMLCLRRT